MIGACGSVGAMPLVTLAAPRIDRGVLTDELIAGMLARDAAVACGGSEDTQEDAQTAQLTAGMAGRNEAVMGSKKKIRKQTIRKKTRRPGARRSMRKAPTPSLPPCAESMGCLCAGHARGNPADAPCDTAEVEKPDGVCCAVCGGTDVQYAVWYSPNDGQTHDEFGSWNAGDNTFCPDCDVNGRNPNPNLVAECSEPEEYLNARSKRLGDSRGGTFIPAKYDGEGQRIDEHGNPIENDEGEL